MFVHNVPENVTYSCKQRQVSRSICTVKDLEEAKRAPDYENRKYVEGYYSEELDNFLHLATKHLFDVEVFVQSQSTNLITLTLYDKNDFVEMGGISVRTLPNSYDTQYCVHSHLIDNQRYCMHNSPNEYFTLTSKNIDKAVKNARKYLRPNRLVDIAKCTHNPVSNNILREHNRRKEDLDRRAHDAGFRVLQHKLPDVAHKMLEMYQMGLVRVDEDMDKQLTALQQALDDVKDLNSRDNEYMTLVWLKPEEVHLHACDVYTQFAYQGAPNTSRGQAVYDPSFGQFGTVFTHNELPHDVQGKVSVLSILDNGEFMYDIGMKLSDSVYYIRTDWNWEQ